MSKLYIIILFVFLVLFLLLIYNGISKEQHLESIININEQDKPYLWVYWELINGATKPPDYITLCINIMKRNCSENFNLVFLNEKTIFNYLPDLRKDINDLPIALKSDYIRVRLLKKYGGLWMDADTIVMTDLKEIAQKIIEDVDFIGFGCTGEICKDNEGYGRPSNGVMGSVRNGKLITRCLNALNLKLNAYYDTPINERKNFNYFELGKLIIWKEYINLMKEDPNYKMYHVPSYSDGTRDNEGKWVALDLIFNKPINYKDRSKLLVVMLANSSYCGNNKKYNWFCKLKRNDILNGDYFVSTLFREALNYNKS
jgi:hypothetical protein